MADPGRRRAVTVHSQPLRWTAPGLDAEFDRLIDNRVLSAVFQPVVELRTGQVVGYEALARGPAGSPFAQPDRLFAHAYRVSRAAELDWVCRAAAFRLALDAALPTATSLFINVEPLSLRTDCPSDLLDVIAVGTERFSVVLELTERALAHDPAAVLDAVRRAREDGLGIAIDDVGAVPTSLAMMPLLHPDVIKLDLSLVQSQPGPVQAQIVNAVLAESERTGAAILAEGIESPTHARTARAMGAALGQGWHYGGPTGQPRLPAGTPPNMVPRLGTDVAEQRTPYEVVTAVRPARPATEELLVSMSRQIEYKAADPSEPAVLLACFQHAHNMGRSTTEHYANVAAAATMVAVLGESMPQRPAGGIRGTAIQADDPLSRQWVVIVIGPHFAAALTAIELKREDPAGPRQFNYAMTHDRALVIAAARPLLHRLRPLSPAGPATPP